MIQGKCTQCGKKGFVVAHHVCYEPEMKQHVCYSCHRLIHKSGNTALAGQYKEYDYDSTKTITVSNDLYFYLKDIAFKTNRKMGQVIEEAILNNVKVETLGGVV